MTEQRSCQNCKQNFLIEDEDFDFYKKISVPPPTFCPECRFQRRLAWINNFALYKRPCNLCGRIYVSTYPSDAPYVAFCPECWWGDAWNQYEYSLEYDPKRPFFEQYNELLRHAPLIGLSTDPTTLKSSPYTSNSGNLKNCYLMYASNYDEDCAYGYHVLYGKSNIDSTLCIQNEWLYDCMHSWKCNHCIGSRSYVIESLDCYFLKDCANCQDCFGCANLRNKKYCMFNEQLTKEEYVRRLSKYDLGSYVGYQKARAEVEAFWNTQIPKAEFGDRNVNCRGTHIYDSKNVFDSFQVNVTEDSRYVAMVDEPKNTDLYDVTYWGDGLALSYESSTVGTQSSGLKFCQESGISCIDLEYCKAVISSSHCFGCVGLKKAKYCILNKQYSKEEYEKLVAKIKEDMVKHPYADSRGRLYPYGEFFPIELSPHGYNETSAQDFFPLSKEKAEKSGYLWREEEKGEYKTTLKASALPYHIQNVSDSVLNEVVECISCGRGFKFIRMELDFLRHMNGPLPRECPSCRIRYKFRLWQKNMEQHERTCAHCGVVFLTKYTETEAPKVLCKKCYNAEVA